MSDESRSFSWARTELTTNVAVDVCARASLQSLASIISQNLLSLSQHLGSQHELLKTIVVSPLPGFPASTEGDLLAQLLRKKLEPRTEAWVDDGRQAAPGHGAGADAHPSAAAAAAAAAATCSELWDWAGRAANEEARKRTWGGNFTLEEKQLGIANVSTGLRRTLSQDGDDEDEDDDEDDDDDDDVGDQPLSAAKSDKGAAEMTPRPRTPTRPPPSNIEDVLRFMCTGVDSGTPAGIAAGAHFRR